MTKAVLTVEQCGARRLTHDRASMTCAKPARADLFDVDRDAQHAVRLHPAQIRFDKGVGDDAGFVRRRSCPHKDVGRQREKILDGNLSFLRRRSCHVCRWRRRRLRRVEHGDALADDHRCDLGVEQPEMRRPAMLGECRPIAVLLVENDLVSRVGHENIKALASRFVAQRRCRVGSNQIDEARPHAASKLELDQNRVGI